MRIRAILVLWTLACALPYSLVVAYAQNGEVKAEVRAPDTKEAQRIRSIALQAYWDRTGNADAQESLTITQIRIAYEIPGFAGPNDVIWEARMRYMGGSFRGKPGVRGVIWINDKTGNVRFIAGTWDDPASTRPTTRHGSVPATAPAATRRGP
jgi:hypothetical protein